MKPNGLEDYLHKTESAVKILLKGINGYIRILEESPPPVYSGDIFCAEDGTELPLTESPDFKSWYKDEEFIIQESINFQRKFIAESFALNILDGSLLQVASMGIQLFSENLEISTDLPGELTSLIKSSAQKRFCIGRIVRKLPIGLIIYTGRNQYNHMDQNELHPLNKKILETIAAYGNSTEDFPADPAFDLSNPNLIALSSNIRGLLNWRSYENYYADMIDLMHESEMAT
jgi:hypothetical protein